MPSSNNYDNKGDTTMATVSLRGIEKVYDNKVTAVKDFNMDIADNEFIVFVGPSGCGKSTTLRMIAGLEEITSGELYIDDLLVNDVEPKNRDIAMVFQNYALYPHMTVYNNMAFALKLRKLSKEEIDVRVREAAEILDITEYLDRKPKALSGGQRQRVALGRAIVRHPKVFLLDEPLSNLDAKLRSVMRTEITKLHHKLKTTFIYVTHDQVEAMTMGSRIVVMKDGFIQQIDAPQNLYDLPANKFVAGFIGTPQMNFVEAVVAKKGTSYQLQFAGQSVKVAKAQLPEALQSGEHTVCVGIRPEDISVHADRVAGSISLAVDAFEALGSETIVYGDVAEGCSLTAKADARMLLSMGQQVHVVLDTNRLHFFDIETEQRI